MSTIQIEKQTIETVYITMHGLKKQVRVSNPDNIPNLEKVLIKKYPVVLLAGWDHTINKVCTGKSPIEFHISWLNPTDKGGMSMFLCEQTDPKSKFLTPSYGLVYYSKGDSDTDESIIEIKKVTEANCFPWK